MPLLETKGAGSAQGFGLSLGGEEAVYIEDVFSTYLYTGNGSTQTITNGIDLAGEGGLVWIKSRSAEAQDGRNQLFDTGRGIGYRLISDSTAAQTGPWGTSLVNNLSSTGFTVGNGASVNYTGENFVSWTFRKQPKFFDVVTYTGNGAVRTIPHSLGSVPGCIIVKSASGGSNWTVYHRGLTSATYVVNLQSTAAQSYFLGAFNNTAPTSTEFTLGIGGGHTNTNGVTYVAYLFAHDAGGFGLTGTDNVISCGSWSGTDATKEINVGFEPQWLLVKQVTASSSVYGNWHIVDTMRGLNVNLAYNSPPYLEANTTDAEGTGNPNGIALTHTGFKVDTGWSVGGWDYIYIAIRRGPMKVPTSGTEVFTPIARTGTSLTASVSAGFVVDFAMIRNRELALMGFFDRLRGAPRVLFSQATVAESTDYHNSLTGFDVQNGVRLGFDSLVNMTSTEYINYFFRRAPSFFDVVCYTGTGSARTVAHNLGVAPELMIFKNRTTAGTSWLVYSAALGATKFLLLNATSASATSNTPFNDTEPTASVFTVRSASNNTSGANIVAYLFATLAGVSKVGSYTGNGSSQTINCGFTGGARFVMIKRTDSTGDWYVWDSARGIVAGNDPHLSLNSTAAEVTTDDSVDTDSTGFVVNQVAATNVNVTSATYIFLAIA